MAKLRFNGNVSLAAGAVGRLLYRRSSVGQQITERGYSKPTETAALLAANADFEQASASWSLLTPAMKNLWTLAAENDKRRDPVTLKVYALTNRAMYIGLSSKFLQINGLGATIPTAPPVVKFKGDTVAVVAGEPKNGVATWVADKPNAAGVKTEMLAQRLASTDRAPQATEYASQGFVAFAAGSLSATVTLGPGIWVLGYRFVSSVSGEERNIRPMGTFVLGLAMVEGGTPDGPGEERKAA